MTAQWVKYDGSDEQIAEIFSANDVLFRFKYRPDRLKSSIFNSDINLYLKIVTEYLICDPHPYADMICQWARTGQPVWIRVTKGTAVQRASFLYGNRKFCYYLTTIPDWNILGAEYSFTPFEEEV